MNNRIQENRNRKAKYEKSFAIDFFGNSAASVSTFCYLNRIALSRAGFKWLQHKKAKEVLSLLIWGFEKVYTAAACFLGATARFFSWMRALLPLRSRW